MSRIGNRNLKIPPHTTVSVEANQVVVVEKNDKLQIAYPPHLLQIHLDNNNLKITRVNDEKQTKMHHGTVNANINNALIGVNGGWKKELDVKGVGFRAKVEGNTLNLGLGFSHPILLTIPAGLKIQTPSPTEIVISGADKAAVGAFAADIRAHRKPEPYKGKGVMYKGEQIIRKAGKTADKKK